MATWVRFSRDDDGLPVLINLDRERKAKPVLLKDGTEGMRIAGETVRCTVGNLALALGAMTLD